MAYFAKNGIQSIGYDIDEEKVNKINNGELPIEELRDWFGFDISDLVKKQLLIWSLKDLQIIIGEINNTELLCKKNAQVSKAIFFNFFTKICKKANNFS